MRYAQRGGYTPAEQRRRELLRLQASERFARGHGISQIAHDLRVTEGFGTAMAPGLAGRRGRDTAVHMLLYAITLRYGPLVRLTHSEPPLGAQVRSGEGAVGTRTNGLICACVCPGQRRMADSQKPDKALKAAADLSRRPHRQERRSCSQAADVLMALTFARSRG
jgi:hypothetical protein